MSNRKRPVEGTATASPLEEGLQEIETKTRRVERIPSAPPPVQPLNQSEDEDEEAVVETDEIMALVQEYGEFNDCTIRVERLPDYQRDGLVGVRANREFCGVIPLHPNFESAIQRSFGGGSYLLTVRDGGNQLLCRVPRHFRALPELAPAAAAPAAVPQPAQPQPQALAPRPVINEVAEELASLKKIDAMLRSIRGEDQERKPPVELDADTMLARFMVQNPQLFKDRMATLLQPGGAVEPAPWYVGVIERFAPTLMELGQVLVYSMAQRQQLQAIPQSAAVANPAPQSAQALPTGVQPIPVQAFQPIQQMPIAAPIPEGPVIPNLEELKTFLSEALFSNADVEPVAEEIVKFLRFKSWYAPLLTKYFDEPVENLAAMLLQEFEQIPDYSQNWLQNLQNAVNARRNPS
jgi:hypothetical protein